MSLLPLILLICNAHASSAHAASLIVGAAADLTRVAPELAKAYQQATGQEVRFSLGASGILAQQLEHGAPYDVFLSADEVYVNEGIKKGYLIFQTNRTYAFGALAIWSRSGEYRTLKDLVAPSLLHLAIANPSHAPYGAAALEALKAAGVWASVQSRVVYGENIRQTLQYAESGNADAAIVSWSLVFDRGGVPVPANLYSPIRQTGAVATITRQQNEAKRFLQFLSSPAGQAVLQRYGFQPPR